MSQRHVAVLFGGPSSEHEVSIASGRQVIAHLDRRRYQVAAVFIDRRRGFHPIADVEGRFELPASPREDGDLDMLDGLEWLKAREVSVVFLALHGSYGEDGCIQALLESAGIPYTGSGVAASALAMDKNLAKLLARATGLPVAPWLLRTELGDRPLEACLDRILREVGLPCILKPRQGGSSVGLELVETKEQLVNAVRREAADDLLVERFIDGDEVTVGVLGSGARARALPPILIRAVRSRLFDYEAKYQPGMAEEICPAPIPRAVAARVTECALKIHEVLGCRGVTRSDFIISDGIPHFLEINTLPGLTENSLVPKAARAAGISFSQLLDALIDASEGEP